MQNIQNYKIWKTIFVTCECIPTLDNTTNFYKNYQNFYVNKELTTKIAAISIIQNWVNQRYQTLQRYSQTNNTSIRSAVVMITLGALAVRGKMVKNYLNGDNTQYKDLIKIYDDTNTIIQKSYKKVETEIQNIGNQQLLQPIIENPNLDITLWFNPNTFEDSYKNVLEYFILSYDAPNILKLPTIYPMKLIKKLVTFLPSSFYQTYKIQNLIVDLTLSSNVYDQFLDLVSTKEIKNENLNINKTYIEIKSGTISTVFNSSINIKTNRYVMRSNITNNFTQNYKNYYSNLNSLPQTENDIGLIIYYNCESN